MNFAYKNKSKYLEEIADFGSGIRNGFQNRKEKMSEKPTTVDQDWITRYTRTNTSTLISSNPSRRRLLHLLGAGGLAGVAGCAGDNGQDTDTETGTETDSGADTQTSATVAIPSSVTRDGAGTHGVIPYWTSIIEPLTWPDSQLNVNPWLAESWDQTSETTWEFYLREDVTFHNGDSLTADAVLFSLRKMLTDQPWTKGWLRMEPEGIKKVDDHTVEITNPDPMPRLPGAVAHLWHSIQHPDSPSGWGGTIGTGPYKLEDLKQDQYVTVSAFDEYWRGAPNIDELTFRTIQDQDTRGLALEGNEVDISFDISPSKYNEVQKSEEHNADVQPLTSSVGLFFNNTNTPTDDVKLRKALNYAVSQETVIEGTLNGIGEPARGPLPSLLWWSTHDQLPEYGPDKDRARTLVEESNYDGERVKLLSSSSPHRVNGPTNPKAAAQIVQQAAGDIGVEVEIRMLEQAAYSEAEDTGEGGHMFQGFSYTIAARPGDLIEDIVGSGPYTFEDAVKEELESLIDEGISAKNNDDAKAALGEAQRILIAEEVFMVPLYYKHYIVGQHKNVEGVTYHPTMRHTRFEDLTLTE